ncbi:hypothetical protein HAX54_012755 [Datura stramonium]|uniref:Uncharacterized protein n=1 Tax=Datura stramonium TaxID=4076 RepID=A0ABS8RXU5_DATST|nr:hypothetical protein [Datura stramonium]
MFLALLGWPHFWLQKPFQDVFTPPWMDSLLGCGVFGANPHERRCYEKENSVGERQRRFVVTRCIFFGGSKHAVGTGPWLTDVRPAFYRWRAASWPRLEAILSFVLLLSNHMARIKLMGDDERDATPGGECEYLPCLSFIGGGCPSSINLVKVELFLIKFQLSSHRKNFPSCGDGIEPKRLRFSFSGAYPSLLTLLPYERLL